MILDGKRVLITGGTGSLAKAVLLRAKEENWNTDFVIFSRDETKQSQLKQKYPRHKYVLGDVAKYKDLRRACIGIDTILHFAAYKQVPSAQNNVPATIETNVIGSQNVVDVAIECGVKQVVASSTDKSCAPVNAYGQSKALMEAIFQHGNTVDGTTFHLARYGNVVCSSSSVIPLFEKLASENKPLTVTHPDMTRFWISLDDAVDLILCALQQTPGTIVVPKAGAMRVYDVAKIVASIHARDEVVITSIRSGEKIHEAMVSEAESFYTWEDNLHYYINPPITQVLRQDYFTYTSDKAPKLTKDQLVRYIMDYYRKYGN